MLREGQRRKSRGTDVVTGFVETYGRPLTMEAAEGLEVIPRKIIEYQGVRLEEMDTLALIARRPRVALIDELAHTNAPGSIHSKRYEDVLDVLEAGINVITTLNIQHLESLNDVVAGVTGVRVHETVPDFVVDNADEVEVIDISPEALRSRMHHGNIYPAIQAERALEGFFRPGNLAALRQLALQRVASGVEHQITEYMHDHRLEGWEAGERVLVVLDQSSASEVALRRAWRLAAAIGSGLVAAYPAWAAREQRMLHILTVAGDLNAVLREIPGDNSAAELLALISEFHVGHVTLVSPPPRRFRFLGAAPLAEQLLAAQPHLDVHLVARRGI